MKKRLLFAILVLGVIIDNLINYMFNDNIGYSVKHKYFYIEGVPHSYYIIYNRYRWCGITFADRVSFCLDMQEVYNFGKERKITFK